MNPAIARPIFSVFTALMGGGVFLAFVMPHVGYAQTRPPSAGASNLLVLESAADTGIPRVARGDAKLARERCSAASTFKVLIAWAALESGAATPATRFEVGDKHIPGTPRSLDLRQALYFSSNDYFVKLAPLIGREVLTDFVLRSQLYPDGVPDDWLGEEWRPIIKGGDLKTTPMQNHLFMRHIAFGSITENASVLRDLHAVMAWPSDHPMIRLYGKTGVWGGAVWFNGFGVKQRNKRVITVYMRGSVERRPEAIAHFYGTWGIRWSPGMNNEVLAE